jgi:hypothetical protein
MRLSHYVALIAFIPAALCPTALVAQQIRQHEKVSVNFNAQRWHSVDNGEKSDVQFMAQEGFPGGLLALKEGSVALNDFDFTDGTIEFDIKPIGEDMPGIQFRTQGSSETRNAEEFYIRSQPDCRASDDCLQYAPVINGFMLWNFYPQYQTQAFVLDGWNHVRLVISGRRMNVYLNQQSQPALSVGELEGEAHSGGIELSSPAYYANLTVTPSDTSGLSPLPLPDPTHRDLNIVRRWQLGSLTAWDRQDVKYSERPGSLNSWKPVPAERFGLVNLDRDFTNNNQPPKVAWMRTTVTSDREQSKQVSLAWLGETWVFVNGRLVGSGKNFYYPNEERRNPDGRLSLDNGSFTLPLQRGSNEIMVAILTDVHDDPTRPNHYGWGLGMRFDNTAGLRFER